eukprot:jgi/Botrbrau1/16486/Bobra.0142s0080.1
MHSNAFRVWSFSRRYRTRPYDIPRTRPSHGYRERNYPSEWNMNASFDSCCFQASTKTLDALRIDLLSLRDDLEKYSRDFPHVQNVSKLKRRVRSEIEFVKGLDNHVKPDTARLATGSPGVEQVPGKELTSNVQGLKNNLRGIRAELLVAREAPSVIAVSKCFRLTNPGAGVSGKPGREPGACEKNDRVEIDVVAQGGHLWIEVKDQGSFGTESSRWAGCRGLESQAMLRLEAAQSPWNQVLWAAPKVLFYFTSGVGEDVAGQLRRLGVLVHSGPTFSNARLPEPPSLPSRCLLDVTTLCGLVSEVSYSPHSEAVRRWSTRNSHWKECLSLEREAPFLQEVGRRLEGQELLTLESSIAQFEALLAQFGGALETARWAGWKSRMKVVSDGDEALTDAPAGWLAARVRFPTVPHQAAEARFCRRGRSAVRNVHGKLTRPCRTEGPGYRAPAPCASSCVANGHVMYRYIGI